jgi:hypothetical protein
MILKPDLIDMLPTGYHVKVTNVLQCFDKTNGQRLHYLYDAPLLSELRHKRHTRLIIFTELYKTKIMTICQIEVTYRV